MAGPDLESSGTLAGGGTRAEHRSARLRIELRLEYGGNGFTMRVRDNGRGLDEPVTAAGQRAGYWELVGMRNAPKA